MGIKYFSNFLYILIILANKLCHYEHAHHLLNAINSFALVLSTLSSHFCWLLHYSHMPKDWEHLDAIYFVPQPFLIQPKLNSKGKLIISRKFHISNFIILMIESSNICFIFWEQEKGAILSAVG